MCCVTGIRTLAQVEMATNWLQPLLAMAEEPVESPAADNQPQQESLCGNPGFRWRSSSTLLEQKEV